MDPEDPLVDPGMMAETGSYRSMGGPPQQQQMQPQMYIPQKLGTVMAMSQPTIGQQRPVVIQAEAQIPSQQDQKREPQPIMIVVPPAAVPKQQVKGESKTKRGECMLPPEPGPCRRDVIRYFFDPSRMSCEIFYYGGCGGNENRFTSVKACYDICSKHDSFVKRPRVLSAKKVIRVTR